MDAAEEMGLKCLEEDLAYSQLSHRAVWLERGVVGKKLICGYPSSAPVGALLINRTRSKMTGRPLYVGQVKPA